VSAALAELECIDLGRTAYRKAWEEQRRRVEERHAGRVGDALLVVEHEPVITVGRGTKGGFLAGGSAPVDVFEVERGGQATWHGPGQIVVYPIVKLAAGRRDLHAWMRVLEQAVIDTVADCGLATDRRPGATGVWVDGQRKLCSIGVAARRWVTWHGLALNHDPDLSQFAAIQPCGFDAGVMTSLAAELGERCPDREAVVAGLVGHLSELVAPFRETEDDPA
jgi:lipoate-protein ligase B